MSHQRIKIRRPHAVIASVAATAYWSINTYSSWGEAGINAMWLAPIGAGFITSYALTNGDQFFNTAPYIAGLIVLAFFRVGSVASIHPLLAVAYFFACTMFTFLLLGILAGLFVKYFEIVD